MNGQLVLFQWADCAVRNLGLEYFFRCAGVVIETGSLSSLEKSYVGKLEPVKEIVVPKNNKEILDLNTFLS